jgi:arylsulfatase A-like enzyme
VSLTDIAPTFLEIAGVDIPEVMTGKSLTGIFKARKEGRVETSKRAFVITGKERHVPGQEDNLGGYPCRAIRSHDFLYIRNFEPDRWPSGTPDYENAFLPGTWLADCDNGPTKTYMTDNREKDAVHQNLWDLSFGLRPAEELYDCTRDPDQLVNLATDPEYSDIKNQLEAQLMEMLKQTADPRVNGGGEKFDTFPYYGGGPRHPSFIEE